MKNESRTLYESLIPEAKTIIDREASQESVISNLLKELNLRTIHMYNHPRNWPEVDLQWDKD